MSHLSQIIDRIKKDNTIKLLNTVSGGIVLDELIMQINIMSIHFNVLIRGLLKWY